MHAHVLHGVGVIVGCRWLLDPHHGGLLSQNGWAVSRVGGVVVTGAI